MADAIQQDAAIDTAVKDIQETKGQLQGASSKLESELSSMQSQWLGQGGSAFGKLQQTWQEKYRTITNALDQLTQGLENTRKTGTQADEEVASSANSVISNIDSLNARLG